MRLTRRGWAVTALVGFGVAMAWLYGGRSLNALVVPLVVVTVAAVLAVARVEEPIVRREPIESGFPGEIRTVRLSIGTNGPTSATLVDEVGDGLTAMNPVGETTIDDGDTIEYDLRLERRGEHAVGPLTIVVTDVLGLVKRRFESRRTTSVLVYPQVHDLRGGARHDLQLLADAAREYDREEFDHLREYERGDDLRDIHWKTTAKRPDEELVVKEFVADERTGSATVAGECDPGRDDEMAEAVASVLTYLRDMDVAVGAAVPDGQHPPDEDEAHYLDVLALLAVTGPGTLDPTVEADADVVLRVDATGATVHVNGHEIPFDRLTSERPGLDARVARGAGGSKNDGSRSSSEVSA